MNKTEIFAQAVQNIPSPETYQQAFQIYKVIGEPFALVLAVPFLFLVMMGAFAEDKYGNSLWDHTGYWIVVIFVGLIELLMVFLFPYLVMSLA